MILNSATTAGARALAVTACTAMLSGGAARATAGGVGSQGGHGPAARAARTVGGSDTAHLHLVHQNETLLYEEGRASGSLPGYMRAQLTVGSLLKGSCTIYTAHGSVTGRGVAAPHGPGRYQSFAGSLTITGGSGRYLHAHGRTGLYGTFDRRTFALVVQTTGRISY